MINYIVVAVCILVVSGFTGMGIYQIVTKRLLGKGRYKTFTEESCNQLAEKEGFCYIFTALGVLLVTLSAEGWFLPAPLMWLGWFILIAAMFMNNRYSRTILEPIPVTASRTKKQIKQAKKVSLDNKGTKKKRR